jgi:hypothetical protein
VLEMRKGQNARDILWTSFVATRNSSGSSGQAVGELVVGHRVQRVVK